MVLLIPFCLIIIFSSYNFVESSWAVSEGSGDPGGLPARYVLKAMIPIGFTLLAMQGISQALSSLLTIFNDTSTGQGPAEGAN